MYRYMWWYIYVSVCQLHVILGYVIRYSSVPQICIKYSIPDAVPPIHGESSHIATNKGPSKFRSIFSNNLQPIATRGKKARGTLLVDIGCSSKRAPLSISYYNEISGGHIGSCCCSEEGLCRASTAPVFCPVGACLLLLYVIWCDDDDVMCGGLQWSARY